MSQLPQPKPETYIPPPIREGVMPLGHVSDAPASAQTTELSLAIKKVTRETEELSLALGVIRSEVTKVKVEADEGDTKLSRRIDLLQGQHLDSERRLNTELSSVRALTKRDPEVSFADIEVIKSKIEAVSKEAKEAHDAASSLKEKEVKILSESIQELKDSKKEGSSSALRDIDNLFHSRSKLQTLFSLSLLYQIDSHSLLSYSHQFQPWRQRLAIFRERSSWQSLVSSRA